MAPLEPDGYTSDTARLLQALIGVEAKLAALDWWITILLFLVGLQYLMLALHQLITW